MTGLTPLQDRAVRFIASRDVCPSFEEIKVELGLASKGNVHALIGQLVDRGYVRRLPHRARSLEVISRVPTPADLARLSDTEITTLAERVGAEMDKRGMP
jgi:SOS-response transcriptional repressor LexA